MFIEFVLAIVNEVANPMMEELALADTCLDVQITLESYFLTFNCKFELFIVLKVVQVVINSVELQ
jgi:hypothetical protein